MIQINTVLVKILRVIESNQISPFGKRQICGAILFDPSISEQFLQAFPLKTKHHQPLWGIK